MNLAEFIIQIESFNANINIPLIRKAYEFSDRAHKGQKRASGEPYVEHCLEVAFILAAQHMDSTTISAGLVHDVVEDTEATIDDLRREFGDEIAELVDGVTKIGAVQYRSTQEEQMEYFRKMLLTMSKDIRVILIKLADRLHNMRTLSHLPEKKRMAIAQETKDIYCPLAHRFGINKIKNELEDLSFKYLEPALYSEMADRLKEKKAEREAYIKAVEEPLREALAKNEIEATVSGRAKHLASIYRKTKVRKVPFEDIYDLFAIRVIVNNERECYHTLGVLHSMWKPVTDRFHDYIANPKPNGYKSLHTTVYGPGQRKVEVQIRTQHMHNIAENGIAAHWLYKEGRQQMSKSDRQMIWLRDVLDWQKDTENASEFLEYLKIDLYSEDIFVFTPQGKIIHLPKGSTPLDFAFQIHSEIGIHCSGAKINGRLQPLSTKLQSGDTIEIVTGANRTPSRDWLKLVKTSSARTRIRRWLKEAGHDQAVELGKQILERKLKEMHKVIPPEDKLNEYAKLLHRESAADLLASIGNGSISARPLLDLISPPEEKEAPGLVKQVIERIRGSKGIKVSGLDDMMFRFAGCCQPVPGEDIVGFISRGRGVTIHSHDCDRIHYLHEKFPERQIDVNWDAGSGHAFVVELEITVEDRKGMLRDLTQAISDSDTNVKGAEMFARDAAAVGRFVVEVTDLSHLNRIIDKVRKVKGVISAVRAKGKKTD